ncbi:hypothetical protein HYH02_000310 [Chlamydomonas schloesseri]|uniref:Flagellar protofilament ribbon protein n=1 Tax=Chlamydomonas schloesseri TaxID=2026947 RepID=A0A835WLY3_9CHLO|nr:hypothetical protein HYH02_000310 [Chlamydomonas schloesseri]|eukprot:KAG2450209.1 hypothetical protein HYH02_000310 [Chlamydomonas schloesseri]
MGRLVAQVPNEDPERLKRVLDAKWRTIGIDKDTLDLQAQEKKDREQAERDRDEAFARLTAYFDDQLTLMQQEADQIRKAYNHETEAFRQQQQLKHTRREWDLNRPDGKQLDMPGRVGDDDNRLGPSSLQKFDGEDLTAGDRKKAQIEQSVNWWAEQTAIKDALRAAEKEAETAHAELVKYQDLLQQTAKSEEDAVRREVARATADYNKRLAEEKRLREYAAKQAELAANMAEMEATITSSFMTEDPNMAASSMSAYRVRKDHYKGMTETEKKAILDAQLAQMEEKKARRAQEQLENMMYARTQHDIQRALQEQAQRVDEFKKAQMARAAEILKKQQEEKADRDKHLASLYRNKMAPEFFTQFGTSHR